MELVIRPISVLLGGETHASTATGTSCGTPCGAPKRCIGWGTRMRTPPLRASAELPMGLRNIVLVRGTHANTAIGVFGGAPYGATKR
eukprot:1284029-Pyramimonas_sp.AAC.1